MDNAIYVNLGRLDGLRAELQVIANNISNAATAGFKKEGVIFSEFISAQEDPNTSLSMATAELQRTDFDQGLLGQTGGTFDFAIDGDGFFMVEYQDGFALTRAGNFTTNSAGELVTTSGNRLLDAGGAPVFIPPDAQQVKLALDGTLSADGQPLTNIGLFLPVEGEDPRRVAATLFTVTDDPVPVENPTLLQGFREDSNVDAILEVARMIEVHRAYEQGANLNKSEDERIRTVLRTLAAQ